MTKTEALQYRAQILNAAAAQDDDDAVESKWMYPNFEDLIGITVEMGFRFNYNEKLWKTEQPTYTFTTQYKPGDPGTESLFSEVHKQGQGTHDNPIPYSGNMELFEGLFYTEDNVLYECFRDTGVPVYNRLADLVNLYVRVSN